MGKKINKSKLLKGFVTLFFIALLMLIGYEFGYYRKFQISYYPISVVCQIIGILISAYLTYKIINQTRNIADTQLKMSTISENNHVNLQKRQFKIDLFDRKVAVFEDILKIFTQTGILISLTNNEKELQSKMDVLDRVFNGMKTIEGNNTNIYSLFRSEFLFNGELLKVIKIIIEQYTEMGAKINILSMFKDQTIGWKEEVYKGVLENGRVILSYQDYINQTSKIELDIAGFER
jgi:hypothetical protein